MREHTIELVCDGELAFCTTCKGGEGSLTTECCGRPITEKEEYEIYNLGILDFVNNKWVKTLKIKTKGNFEMKVNCEKIVEALEVAALALETNVLVPSYKCFRIKGKDILATDGIMIINTHLDEDIGVDCLVPGAPLLFLIKSLKEDEIKLVAEKSQLNVVTKKVKGSFVTTNVEDFIVKPSYDDVEWEKCEESFLDGLDYCRYSTSKDVTSVLGGIYVKGEYVYATDRYRIMRYKTNAYNFLEEGFVLPAKFVNVILGIRDKISYFGIQPKKEKFVVRLKNNTTISTSYSLDEYPDLDPHFLLDMEDFQKIQFPEGILDVLNLHIGFQKPVMDSSKRIIVEIEETDCIISTEEPDVGDLKILEIIKKVDSHVKFEINPMFLKNILKICLEFWCNPERYLVVFKTDKLEYIVKTVKKLEE